MPPKKSSAAYKEYLHENTVFYIDKRYVLADNILLYSSITPRVRRAEKSARTPDPTL